MAYRCWKYDFEDRGIRQKGKSRVLRKARGTKTDRILYTAIYTSLNLLCQPEVKGWSPEKFKKELTSNLHRPSVFQDNRNLSTHRIYRKKFSNIVFHGSSAFVSYDIYELETVSRTRNMIIRLKDTTGVLCIVYEKLDCEDD